jgi:hypothetical protein
MTKVLSPISVSTTDRVSASVPAIPAERLPYLSNVDRLSKRFYTGYRYILSPNVRPMQWATIHQPLGDGFIEYYADPLCALGVGFGANTSYMMQDIDYGSPYHPCNDPRAFTRFLDTLDRIGLTTPVIINSSESGGIHVYYFFDRDLNTFRIATLGLVTLIKAKFDVENGHLELFPNAKPYGDHCNKSNHKPHRLPLQRDSGGAILDRNGNPLECGVNLNHETQLAAFLQMAKASALGNDIEKIERQLDPIYAEFKSDPTRFQYFGKRDESENAKKWRKNLQTAMGIGWTGYHQTNVLIPKFIAYAMVFLGIDDKDDLYEWALENIPLAPGYSEFCRHQRDIQTRIRDWVDLSIDNQFYVKYCGYPPRSDKRNSVLSRSKTSKATPTSKSEVYLRKQVDLTAQRLQSIVDLISDIPNRIGDLIEMIQAKSKQLFGQGFSKGTLYQSHYKSIWVKLLGRNKCIDIVPNTLITEPNMEYLTQTLTEPILESTPFYNTDSSLKTPERISGETWYPMVPPMKCLCPHVGEGGDELAGTGVNLYPQLSTDNNSLPDLPPQSIEPQPNNLSLSPSQPEGAPIDLIPDSDINPHSDPIGTPVEPYTSLIVRDRVQLIDSPDPAHKIGVIFRIAGSIATVVWKATTQATDYLLSELRVVDLPNPTTDLDRHSESLKRRQRQSIEQNRLFPHINDRVRPVDVYHVHGADIGIVTAIESYGVFVNWEDGSMGRYAIDELVTIDPAPT